MQITKGHLAAWAATSQVLQVCEPGELELLPDIAASVHDAPARIRGVPGAFGFDVAQVQSAAVVIYAVAVDALGRFGPKLFDVALDVTKDGLKEWVKEKVKAKPAVVPAGPSPAAPTPPPAHPVDPMQVRDWVRVAALERKISVANADNIANAVLAQLMSTAGPK